MELPTGILQWIVSVVLSNTTNRTPQQLFGYLSPCTLLWTGSVRTSPFQNLTGRFGQGPLQARRSNHVQSRTEQNRGKTRTSRVRA